MNNVIQNLLMYTKSVKLLYVEDNEEARGYTLELLKRFFDDISVAINGIEGLELFNASSFDLIITDINMPVMDGIEMGSKIREINSKIPIIFLSAHNEINLIESAKEIESSVYLSKPIDLEKFIKVLEKIAEEHYS